MWKTILNYLETEMDNEKSIDEQYLERMKTAENTGERRDIAAEENCPLWLLTAFCKEESEYMVVEAAVLNLNCPADALQIAFQRFPELESTKKLRDRKIQIRVQLKEELEAQEREAKKAVAGDRDQVLLNHILEKDRQKNLDHASSHLGDVPKQDTGFVEVKVDWAPTEKYRVALVMPPCWGIVFPPYNLAKLTGVLRSNDYSVKVYDVNIESYHYFLKYHDQDYWKSERFFLWSNKANFEKYILPDLAPLLDRVIDEVIASKVKVVGLSLYATNFYACLYVAKTLRILYPDICIVAGGPETITGHKRFNLDGEAGGIFNYVFMGEAEENFLNTLENLPEQLPMNEIVGSLTSRLNLDAYAFPDYTDYNLYNYLNRGISIETSRGCVAQCSFCAETYFWKFRSLTPERVVDEIEHQIKSHNVYRFWFVDSLVNGNIKNFEKLVDCINERGLLLDWNSYARCDGRMDEEFFRKIRKSGCTALSFGVESGSQKVLDDMRKKIKVWEIENNLRDGKAVDMFNHLNWLIGFPTEEPIDHFHSMQLLYNIRKWGAAISPGFTAGPSHNSHMETDWQIYEMQWVKTPWDNTFLNQWYTTGFKNTILHRFLRLKMFHIWLEIMSDYKDNKIFNSQRYTNIKDFYKFSFEVNPDIEYMEQDYNVNFSQFGNSFEGTVINEYVAFVYMLHKYFGECKFELRCNQAEDLDTFGGFLARMYDCNLEFEVDADGNYSFKLDHTFTHDTPDEELKRNYYRERKLIGNKSFKQTLERRGNIKDWQTKEPQVRETVHTQYREKKS